MKVSELQVEAYSLDAWGEGLIDVRLENRHGRNGAEHWAIVDRSCCLNKSGEWEFEPIPSSRDEEFFARCRWPSAQAALDFYVSHQIKSRFEHYRDGKHGK